MKSLRNLYRIGKGPSSSHTMGPEAAALRFKSFYGTADFYEATLYGSLALTGKGHLTDEAVRNAFFPKTSAIIFDTETAAYIKLCGKIFDEDVDFTVKTEHLGAFPITPGDHFDIYHNGELIYAEVVIGVGDALTRRH